METGNSTATKQRDNVLTQHSYCDSHVTVHLDATWSDN